ncbi:hypothetical protein EIP91_007128 [Steccherinum ochraceum]|uniref:Uncharacterized protein n=1 Tax=Steccherinum ochraceum TaxID=92696 RepID=A0A4R0R4L3_9APHY|nr:hypothetical protein EIP91_007128 [Steccherinum ochraceum]
MDVDMHSSPTFRSARTASGPGPCKRPRSPPSPSPLERPSKRISFGVHNNVSLPLAQLGLGVGPMRSARQLSASGSGEDWVTQTRGLRIESSPIVESEMYPPPPANAVIREEEEDGERDQGMVEDERMPEDDIPQPTLADGSDLFGAAVHSAEQMMFSPNPSPSLSYHGALHFQNPLQVPAHEQHTYLSSHTPPIPTTSHSEPLLSSLPHASAESEMRACMTPEPHAIPLPVSPLAGRKPRFTMGPRQDCEKCRRGVKGHWVHLD